MAADHARIAELLEDLDSATTHHARWVVLEALRAHAEPMARELLATDLPEPLTAANWNPVWRADNTLMVTRYPDGEIAMLLNPKQEARYTPQTARTQAALLLAAANHKEAQHG